MCRIPLHLELQMIDCELLCGCWELPVLRSSGCLIAQNIETHRHLLASALADIMTSCLSFFFFKDLLLFSFMCICVAHVWAPMEVRIDEGIGSPGDEFNRLL